MFNDIGCGDDACGYKQLKTMLCYCPDFEVMRYNWAANQNIATKE